MDGASQEGHTGHVIIKMQFITYIIHTCIILLLKYKLIHICRK